MLEKEGIEELLFRYYQGETLAEENTVVENWLSDSEDNRKLARDVQMISFAADMSQVASQVDREEELKRIHLEMGVKKNNRYLTIKRWMQKAAVLSLIHI